MQRSTPLIVSPHEEGLRLQAFLYQHLPSGHSRRKIKQLIESNCCRIDGRVERFASTRVVAGSRVEVSLPQKQGKPKIIYQDDHLVVCDKPAGFLAVGAGSVVDRWFDDVIPVHRLDRDTSGLFALAKDEPSAEGVERQFRARSVYKRYLALVVGGPRHEQGVIDSFLGVLGQCAGQTKWGIMPTGKRAITQWQVIRREAKVTLISCIPKTGRTHQIRVHLASLGCPVVGDRLYGSYHSPLGGSRHLLHAHQMAFAHPITGEVLRLESPLPKEFREVIRCAS